MKYFMLCLLLLLFSVLPIFAQDDSTDPKKGDGIEDTESSSEPIPVTEVSFEDHPASVGIWGDWVIDAQMTEALGNKTEFDRLEDEVYSFSKNELKSKKVIGELAIFSTVQPWLKGPKKGMKAAYIRAMQEVHATGQFSTTATVDGKRQTGLRAEPFALTVYRGQPTMLFINSRLFVSRQNPVRTEIVWETRIFSFLKDQNGSEDRLLLAVYGKSYTCLKRKITK